MSALRRQLYFIWKRLSEKSSRRKFKSVFFRNDFERYAQCASRKSPARMRREMAALQQYWDCYPFQYYRFDFYRTDCALSVEDMKKYVPLYFLHHLYFPHSYKDYGILCEDKLLTYATLKAFELRQPNLLFCFDNQSFSDDVNSPLRGQEVDALLKQTTANTLFVKPRFGSEGKGIGVFNRQQGVFVNEKSEVLDHNYFMMRTPCQNIKGRDTSCRFIIQEGLAQHPELSAIYPYAINTFRAITECVNGVARVRYCVLRLGSGGRQVDNASAGGIFVRLNLDTGELYDTAQAFDQSTCDRHPDTGVVFKGLTLQTWAAAKAFTLCAARKFRDIRFLGWDVAVTPEGPALIEFNNKPDMAGIQDSYGGLRDELNINPKDWWYQTNYTLKNL